MVRIHIQFIIPWVGRKTWRKREEQILTQRAQRRRRERWEEKKDKIRAFEKGVGRCDRSLGHLKVAATKE
jgi:hypothetical protein